MFESVSRKGYNGGQPHNLWPEFKEMLARERDEARMDLAPRPELEPDLELESVSSEEEDYASSPAQCDITTYSGDFPLETWYEQWQDGEIILPEFQRGYVWKPAQASRLIESFLLGLPVPPVFLYGKYRSLERLVIDGQQRLKSVFYFMEGRFGADTPFPGKEFRLTGLSPESPYRERTFADLWDWDQKRVKGAPLRVVIVESVRPGDYASVYPVFERLHSGCAALSNQEIRNAVNGGRLVAFLRELNRDPQWRQILGKETPDCRERDGELLVRFLALRNGGGYRKPMKDYLSRFMQEYREAPEAALAPSGQVFRETCRQVVAALGEKPFHGKAGLKVAVMDAVLVAFSENLERVPADAAARYQRLRQDADFIRDTEQGTTEPAAVQRRLAQAKQVLFG